jgi:hypothetical protein
VDLSSREEGRSGESLNRHEPVVQKFSTSKLAEIAVCQMEGQDDQQENYFLAGS